MTGENKAPLCARAAAAAPHGSVDRLSGRRAGLGDKSSPACHISVWGLLSHQALPCTCREPGAGCGHFLPAEQSVRRAVSGVCSEPLSGDAWVTSICSGTKPPGLRQKGHVRALQGSLGSPGVSRWPRGAWPAAVPCNPQSGGAPSLPPPLPARDLMGAARGPQDSRLSRAAHLRGTSALGSRFSLLSMQQGGSGGCWGLGGQGLRLGQEGSPVSTCPASLPGPQVVRPWERPQPVVHRPIARRTPASADDRLSPTGTQSVTAFSEATEGVVMGCETGSAGRGPRATIRSHRATRACFPQRGLPSRGREQAVGHPPPPCPSVAGEGVAGAPWKDPWR